jgi:hypothetical protein
MFLFLLPNLRLSRRRPASPRPGRARLGVEALESRDAPSSLLDASTGLLEDPLAGLSPALTETESTATDTLYEPTPSSTDPARSDTETVCAETASDPTTDVFQPVADTTSGTEDDAEQSDQLVAVLAAAANQMPPEIEDFFGQEVGTQLYRFVGRVLDADPATVQVTLSGLPSVEGMTGRCEADGTFVITAGLEPNEGGTVSAVAVNAQGLRSETALYVVRQT